jgi:hypothetical protein
MGFRSFDLHALLPQEQDHGPASVSGQAQLSARREAARTQDTQDAERWADDGGPVAVHAIPPRWAPR